MSSGHTRIWPRSDESEENGDGERSNGSRMRSRSPRDRRYAEENGKRRRSRSPGGYRQPYGKRSRISPPPPPRTYHAPESSRGPDRAAEDRAARLAAMSSNASSLTTDRQKRLTAMLEKEKAELEAEERAREKSRGMGGFLSHEQKKVFGGSGGLEERIRRGRGGMVVDAD